nr:embryogenesis-associated protein EMB8-like [Solanum lycopersicum]
MARATPISSSFRHLKNLSNSSPPLHVTFRRPKTSCATTMSDDKVPHPSLEVIAGAGDKFLSAFKSLHNPYSSYPIVDGNLHIEAIFAAFFRSVRLRRECLRTKDDGSVALDWVSGDDRSLPSDSPLLILLVGLLSIASLLI